MLSILHQQTIALSHDRVREDLGELLHQLPRERSCTTGQVPDLTQIIILDSWVLFLAEWFHRPKRGVEHLLCTRVRHEEAQSWKESISFSIHTRSQTHMRCVIRCRIILFKKFKKLNLMVVRTIDIYVSHQHGRAEVPIHERHRKKSSESRNETGQQLA